MYSLYSSARGFGSLIPLLSGAWDMATITSLLPLSAISRVDQQKYMCTATDKETAQKLAYNTLGLAAQQRFAMLSSCHHNQYDSIIIIITRTRQTQEKRYVAFPFICLLILFHCSPYHGYPAPCGIQEQSKAKQDNHANTTLSRHPKYFYL